MPTKPRYLYLFTWLYFVSKLLDGWTIWLMYHGKFARDIRQTLQKGGAKVIGEGCHWRTIEKVLAAVLLFLDLPLGTWHSDSYSCTRSENDAVDD